MADFKIHQEGWISVVADGGQEDCAKQIRLERDQHYGNIFEEADTDVRWVGDLGEIVFDSWLRHLGITGYQWLRDDAAGKPDFVTATGVRIGAKTVKRKGPPKRGYTAQITARHAEEPIDHFFFLTYEIAQHRMWLLGGIGRERFLARARYYAAGEWVHPQYQVRAGHEIHNIEIEQLTAPAAWLKEVT